MNNLSNIEWLAKDRRCESTADGRFQIGQAATITLEWAEELSRYVYQGTKSTDEVRELFTGTIVEIWACESASGTEWMIRIDCPGPDPWEIPENLEHVATA